MNRRRRFGAKRKRTTTKWFNDIMAAAHLNADERASFVNLYQWPSELHTTEQALLVQRVCDSDRARMFMAMR